MVITIMGIMSSVGFVSLQSSKVDSRLKAAQGEVSTTIKLAQSYALQGKTQNIGGENKTPCGYGFRFTDASHYVIFYNTPLGGRTCAALQINANGRHFYNDVTVVSTDMGLGSLNNNVTLSLSPFVSADTEVYFKIPFGNIYDGAGAIIGTNKTFTFDYTGITKSITMQSNGSLIENN